TEEAWSKATRWSGCSPSTPARKRRARSPPPSSNAPTRTAWPPPSARDGRTSPTPSSAWTTRPRWPPRTAESRSGPSSPASPSRPRSPSSPESPPCSCCAVRADPEAGTRSADDPAAAGPRLGSAPPQQGGDTPPSTRGRARFRGRGEDAGRRRTGDAVVAAGGASVRCGTGRPWGARLWKTAPRTSPGRVGGGSGPRSIPVERQFRTRADDRPQLLDRVGDPLEFDLVPGGQLLQ